MARPRPGRLARRAEPPAPGPAREARPDEGRIDLPVARWRLAGLAGLAVLFVAGSAWALATAGPVGAAVLGAGIAFFGLGALAALRDLLRREPVVSVSAHGIFDRRLSTGWIPWSALAYVGEVGLGAQAFLCLHPRAEGERALPWTRRARLAARLNRWLGGGYWLAGQGVQGGVPAIVEAIAKARGRRR